MRGRGDPGAMFLGLKTLVLGDDRFPTWFMEGFRRRGSDRRLLR